KELTTGAGNDFEQATEIARKMVCEWGMSETMGPLTFGRKEEQIFLGKELARPEVYSEGTADKIDDEVRKIVFQAYERAKEIVAGNKDARDRIAKALLEREVLDGTEVARLIKDLPLLPVEDATQPTARKPAVDSPQTEETEQEKSPRKAPVTPDPLKQPG
ncbi:MAG: cell division protein FtsH, partial [Acidobacteriota bacterium]